MVPMFIADWRDAVFIHFRVDPVRLQPLVPFDLDLFEGDAYVSLAAFTQARLRPSIGGRLTQWLSTPLASHEFLNLRTYVRHEQERGIYFMAEWIPNRLAVLIGPRTYGLPYRLGRLNYSIDRCMRRVEGRVSARGKHLAYRGTYDSPENIIPNVRMRDLGFRMPRDDRDPSRSTVRDDTFGKLTEFLVERYVAFTSREGVRRCFHVEHDRWPIVPLQLDLPQTTLIDEFDLGLAVCAQFSPGVQDVSISPPQRTSRRRWCTLG